MLAMQQSRLLSRGSSSSSPLVATRGSSSSVVRPSVAVQAGVKLAPLVESLKADQLKSNLPEVHIGDSVRMGLEVSEGKGKTRTQRVEGVVIAQSGSGSTTTITVRRVFQGIGLEMKILLHSQVLSSIEVTRRAKVRRAKLYYLRERTGKSARLKELIVRKDKAAAAAAAAAPAKAKPQAAAAAAPAPEAAAAEDAN